MPVSRTFRADCKATGAVTRCRLSDTPASLARLLAALGDGRLARATLVRKGRPAVVEIEVHRDEIGVQSAVLQTPPRWVIQVATKPLQLGPIEDELPFRVYPMAGDPFTIELPPSGARRAIGPDLAHTKALDRCRAARDEGGYARAWRLCEAIDRGPADGRFARVVVMTLGEIASDAHATPLGAALDRVIEALQDAEEAAETKLQAVRYALLAARVYRRAGLPGRADAHLNRRRLAYKGTSGEPYLIATNAKSLLESGQKRQAKEALEGLRKIAGDAPMVGAAMIGLAGLAYQEGDYVGALGGYDVVRERWPEVLTADSKALIHAAEIFNLYGRERAATGLYREYLARYPNEPPYWLAQVRLAVLETGRQPLKAYDRLRELTIDMRVQEGQDLLFLHQARLARSPAERRRIIRKLRGVTLTDYVYEEVLFQSARAAVAQGRLREALADVMSLREAFPKSAMLRRAPLFFDRLLLLLAENYLRADRLHSLVSLYYNQRAAFDAPSIRGEARLLVGRGLRRLAMTEEALSVLQGGVTPAVERHQPDTAARLYLEAAGVLREARDPFRLKKMVAYLDARHPGRFDNYAYWMAKGADAEWSGKLALARQMYVFALNGPVSPAQRARLAGTIATIYFGLDAPDKAVTALHTQLELHDAAKLPFESFERRDARWRIAETEVDRGRWPQAIVALGHFIEEYPDDPERFEARFLRGRGLQLIGDERGALRQWDQVSKENPEGTFGRLAKIEMQLSSWARKVAPLVEQRAGMAAASPPGR